MSVISASPFRIAKPCGAAAVYLIQPEDMAKISGVDCVDRAMEVGNFVAEEVGGTWLAETGEEITDLRTIALLERAPSLN